MLLRQLGADRIDRRAIARDRDAERPRDCVRDELRLPDLGEGDETDTIGESVTQFGRDLKGQPRLPNPTRSRQRHQRHIVAPEQRTDRRHLALPPDERRPRQR